ncbi:MAG: amidophosphoribosyltransferase [Parcubacteria group bacterium Gr01-1014_70]|nr:MAG: amidophosphoribosyltransferase [Parcubacteria group bacterium Gr01-1014_70]
MYIVASARKRAQAHGIHFPSHAALLAMPLHPRKKRMRGFNQSELLASHVSHSLGLPLIPHETLERTRNTPPQAQTGGREKRMRNMVNAFTVPQEHAALIQNKTVILVDDIATTGSTLNNAARALKKAGAAHVWGLVVAKG